MSKEENKEMTKIVNKKCQDCDKHISILCNESAQIMAIRCPNCLRTFRINAMNPEQLREYLKKKGWKEMPFGREEVLKFKSPRPIRENVYLEVWIPSKRELIDYTRAIEIAIEAISAFERRTFDDVLSEVLEEGVVEE